MSRVYIKTNHGTVDQTAFDAFCVRMESSIFVEVDGCVKSGGHMWWGTEWLTTDTERSMLADLAEHYVIAVLPNGTLQPYGEDNLLPEDELHCFELTGALK